jgi:3D (Asp-Asp-Asp) domain-containing protein
VNALLLGLMLCTGYVEAGVTADGTPTGPGTAACPPSLPFGTVLEVEDVGRVVCHDTYAPYLSDRLDIFVPSVADAYALTGPHRVWLITD